MAVLPKRAGKLDINIEEGAQLPINLIVADKKTKVPIDLTGYTAHMQIRLAKDSPDPPLLDLTNLSGITLGGVTGTVQVFITASQASTVFIALAGNVGVYDLELIPSSGIDDTWRFLEGDVFTDGEVTK